MTSVGPISIYPGYDNRVNINDASLEVGREWGVDTDLKITALQQVKSIACMIFANYFDVDSQTREYTLKGPRLDSKILTDYQCQLAEDEKFSNEPCVGFGTAFAVSKDTVLTAAHCILEPLTKKINESFLETIRLIFNFRMEDHDVLKTQYNEKEIYKIKKVISYKHAEGLVDWAWVKLDRPLEGITPLEIDFSPSKEGMPLYSIGHPMGLPAKLVTSAKIESNDKTFFKTKLSVFRGCSGSPIFDKITKKVVGLLFFGNKKEYKKVKNYLGPGMDRCKVQHVEEKDIAKGNIERCLKMSEVMIPLDQRISWISERDREKNIRKYNEKVKEFERKIKEIYEFIKSLDKPIIRSIFDIVKKRSFLEKQFTDIQKMKSFININTIEAYILSEIFNGLKDIHDFFNPNDPPLEIYDFIRDIKISKDLKSDNDVKEFQDFIYYFILFYVNINSIAFDSSGSFSFMDISDKQVTRLVKLDRHFQYRFSPNLIFKLIEDEVCYGYKFSKQASELILTYMHADENLDSAKEKAHKKWCKRNLPNFIK